MTSTPRPDAETTTDALLGGRVVLSQPRRGYRAGVDAVLLAASVTPMPGQRVLDLGCGVGAVALCLAARVKGLTLTGVECQANLAALARQNAATNAAEFTVYDADIAALPSEVRQAQFHHVVANPPYFGPADIGKIADPIRDRAHREHLALAQWVAVAAKRLAAKGRLSMIQRMDRLPEMLHAAQQAGLGALVALPIGGRAGRPPDRVILSAQKDRKTAFRLQAPFYLHEGAHHSADRPDYTKDAQRILLDGQPLDAIL